MDRPALIDFANLDEASFRRLYSEGIEPCFAGNEELRQAAVSSFKTRLLLGSLGVIAVGAGVYLWAHQPTAGLVAAFMAAVLACIWAYQPLANVGKKLKREYCAAIAAAMGATFKLDGFEPPAFDRLRELNLAPRATRSHFEDWFSGTYRDASFDLYEAHLEQRRSNGKSTHYVTVFRGQLMRLRFPRAFLGVTIVRRDAGVFNGLGGGRGLQRVRLDDPQFERAFEVWGNDQVEARYLLHPVMMERLLELERALRGKRLRCAFQDGDLLIAVEGGNLFEPGDLFKPLVDPARARRIVDEVSSVMRVMEQVLTAQSQRP